MPDRALILRIIPYSDSSRIVKCLVDGKGLQSFFIRTSKKTGAGGHIQTGRFIEYTTSEKSNGIRSIKESRQDSALGTNQLNPDSFGVWLFTLELLNKSLQEDFNIPGLSKKIDQYYSHLSHNTISNDPIIPLILLSQTFGIFDTKNLSINAAHTSIQSLTTLDIPVANEMPPITFSEVLERFKNHFSIQTLESVELL